MLVLVLAANEALLDLPLEDLGQLRVAVATGTLTSLAATPAAASLRQVADMSALGSRTVDEALAGIPGLHVSSYGGPQGTTCNTLAVGAYGEDSSATGIDGAQGDNTAADSGAVYLYRAGAGRPAVLHRHTIPGGDVNRRPDLRCDESRSGARFERRIFMRRRAVGSAPDTVG